MTDWQLIQDFVDKDSQTAFAELLRRYMDLVHSTCLRELNDSALAEDTTQAVFLILVRKAPHLRPNRQESRMQQSQTGELSEPAQADLLLNEALRTLPTAQRALLLERFFQQRSLVEIGTERGISEDAARMRVNRALDRLRRFFAARDVALSAAALAVVLGQAIRPAPTHCAEALLWQKLSQELWSFSSVSPGRTIAHAIAQGAIHAMNIKRLSLQLGAVTLAASLSLGAVGAVRVTRQAKARASQAEKQQEQKEQQEQAAKTLPALPADADIKATLTTVTQGVAGRLGLLTNQPLTLTAAKDAHRCQARRHY